METPNKEKEAESSKMAMSNASASTSAADKSQSPPAYDSRRPQIDKDTVIARYKISPDQVETINTALTGYHTVILADDSTSMTLPTHPTIFVKKNHNEDNPLVERVLNYLYLNTSTSPADGYMAQHLETDLVSVTPFKLTGDNRDQYQQFPYSIPINNSYYTKPIFDIVSMQIGKANNTYPVVPGTEKSRWQDCKEAASKISDIAALADDRPDLVFLHGSEHNITAIMGADDPRLEQSFNKPLHPGTPLKEKLIECANTHFNPSANALTLPQKPLNVVIITDGGQFTPGDVRGQREQMMEFANKVKEARQGRSIAVSIMAMTTDPSTIKLYDDHLESMGVAGMTEGYAWERREFTEAGKDLTEGDWLVKGLTSGVSKDQQLSNKPKDVAEALTAQRAAKQKYLSLGQSQEPQPAGTFFDCFGQAIRIQALPPTPKGFRRTQETYALKASSPLTVSKKDGLYCLDGPVGMGGHQWMSARFHPLQLSRGGNNDMNKFAKSKKPVQIEVNNQGNVRDQDRSLSTVVKNVFRR